MKKYLFGIFAIALAIGFSAFNLKSPDPTYYGIKSGSNFVWTTVDPTSEDLTCLTETSALACEIQSPDAGVTSLTNQFPTNYTIIQGSGKVYR